LNVISKLRLALPFDGNDSKLKTPMPTTPLLVIISGFPATGKTYLAQELSKKYKLPLFYKDAFKEMMYDNFGRLPEREESWFMGKCSNQTLEIVSKELLSKGISHIIESNFSPEIMNPYLKELRKNLEFKCLQIHLTCDKDVLLDRFMKRSQSQNIHPGHQGMRFIEEVKENMGKIQGVPFDIDSERVVLDTTSLKDLKYDLVFDALKKYSL